MRKTSPIFFSLALVALGQTNFLTVAPPAKITVKRGSVAETRLAVTLQSGYHVNSNAPADEYLIPLRLQWQPGALEVVGTVFPKPKMENYSFSDKPVSVFTGTFDIVTKFKAGPAATAGAMGVMAGKLRYQACTEDRCFPPKTVDVKLPYSVH